MLFQKIYDQYKALYICPHNKKVLSFAVRAIALPSIIRAYVHTQLRSKETDRTHNLYRLLFMLTTLLSLKNISKYRDAIQQD